MTLFDTLTAAAGSEMGPSQHSLHKIKSTRDAQEGKQEKRNICKNVKGDLTSEQIELGRGSS